MDKSSFYIPEPEPKLIIIERPPIPKTPTPFSLAGGRDCDRDRDSGYPPSSYRGATSKISRLTGQSNISIPNSNSNSRHNYSPSTASTKHGYAASIASTVKTTKTTKSERERRVANDWENFYIGEEDSEDDAYDKMILGRSMAKIVPEVRKKDAKRDKKKALKWLGLA